jgi:DNA polymerase eta
LHHRQGAQTRSRSCPIPQGRQLTEQILFDLAKNLLVQVVVDGRAWPCANLSLSAAGFEEGITNNQGIGGFLVRGDEAKALLERDQGELQATFNLGFEPPPKRRKTDDNAIRKFFIPKADSRDSAEEHSELEDVDDHNLSDREGKTSTMQHDEELNTPKELPPSAQGSAISHLRQQTIDSYFCERCKVYIPIPNQDEHTDWHFAKDLSKELQAEDKSNSNTPRPEAGGRPTPSRGRGKTHGAGASGKGAEKGQLKLAFGKG